MIEIKNVDVIYNFTNGELISDKKVETSYKKLGALKGIFKDEDAFNSMNPDEIVYHVEMHKNGIEEGKSGGLFFGTSFVHPGKVGNEYYMTKGHFHKNLDTAEYYFGIAGEGLLLLQDLDGNSRLEKVKKGSLHYINGNTAHRLINTGNTTLIVGACWPADAGHDYSITENGGFKVRVYDGNGKIVVKEE